tara:strand:- start:172 stop:378 length:207 start_codon:yes stop_codon:yes gene_type:complete
MESIWQYGGYGMNDNRLRQITYLSILILSFTFWYFIIMYPIKTILTIIILPLIVGLILKYNERNFWND